MPRRLQAKLRDFRERLFQDAVERMLATEGCASFSTDRLAKDLSVGKGTVYAHFPSQRECVEATLAAVAARAMEGLPPASGTPEQRLLALTDGLVAALAQGFYGRLPLPCCLRVSPCPYKCWATVEEPLCRLIEAGMRGGQFAGVSDPKLAARALHHLLTALRLDGRLHGERLQLLTWFRRTYLQLLGIAP
jgi:AcrR family transcriptional regulator